MMSGYEYIYDSCFRDTVILQKQTGKISGVYKHTINFKVDQTLFSIVCGTKAPLSAFFLYLPHIDSFEAFQVMDGDLVSMTNTQLSLGSYRLPLQQGACFQPPQITIERIGTGERAWYAECLRRSGVNNGFVAYMLGAETGLNVIDQFMSDTLHSGQIDQLAGIGFGLTPAGDDFLCGYYTALYFLNVDSSQLEKLEFIIKTKWHQLSDVSRQQYEVCFRKRMSKIHLEFAKHFIENNAGDGEFLFNMLARYGHSSGIDYSTGVAYAVLQKEKTNV